jgi:hypothetical protein
MTDKEAKRDLKGVFHHATKALGLLEQEEREAILKAIQRKHHRLTRKEEAERRGETLDPEEMYDETDDG